MVCSGPPFKGKEPDRLAMAKNGRRSTPGIPEPKTKGTKAAGKVSIRKAGSLDVRDEAIATLQSKPEPTEDIQFHTGSRDNGPDPILTPEFGGQTTIGYRNMHDRVNHCI